MTSIRKNPDYQPVTVDLIATGEAVGERINNLLERALALECEYDAWVLDEDRVLELADVRLRLADYAMAQTIDRFDLDIRQT